MTHSVSLLVSYLLDTNVTCRAMLVYWNQEDVGLKPAVPGHAELKFPVKSVVALHHM